MYNDDLVKICKIDNGFLVEVRVKKDPKDAKSEDKGCCHTFEDPYEYKSYAVKTVEEVSQTVAKMLPVAIGKTADDEFENAFEEASKMNETMDEEMSDEE